MRLQTEEIEIDFAAPPPAQPETARGQARIDELLDALPDTFSAPRRIHLLQEAARIYVNDLDQPESAIVVLQAALREDMHYAPVFDALADLAERTGGWNALLADIMQEAEECEGSDPVLSSQRWIRAASWYFDPLGEQECAQCALDRALALAPDSMPALELQARLFLKACRWAEVLTTWDLLRAQPLDRRRRVELLVSSGQIAKQNLQDSSRATEYYRQALEFDDSSVEALDELESIYRQSQSTASLCRILWKKARLQDDRRERLGLELEVAHLLDADAETEEQARRVFARIDDVSGAVALLTSKADSAPTDERAVLHYRIARLLSHRGEAPATIEWHLQETLSHDSDCQPSATMLLRLYEEQGEWGKAATLFEGQAQRSTSKRTKVKGLMRAARIYRERLNLPMRAASLCREARSYVPGLAPAAKVLAEIHFEREEWDELFPLTRELLGSATPSKPEQLGRIHLMAGACAHAQDDVQAALGHYEVSQRNIPGDPMVQMALGQLHFDTQSWQHALEHLQSRLQHSSRFQTTEQEAEVLYMLGEAHRHLGHGKPALARIQAALALVPRHRQALAAQTELFAARGDWKVVANAKRNRLQTATDEVKAMLLADLGDIECDELQSPERALAAYREALSLQPDDHRTMQRILDVAARLKQWSLAYEMVVRFAELESGSKRQGQYYLAAAEICRDKLRNLPKAVELYDRSLDAFFANPSDIDDGALPRYMKAFADLDAILTAEKAWKRQEEAYRRMIKRLPAEHLLVASLWTSLAEIYRSRLRQPASAITALQVVCALTPGDLQRREQLAELYALSGVDEAENAIAEHQAIISLDAERHGSYVALAELYRRTNRHDAHWNLCQALVVLDKATPDQRRFVQEHRATFSRAPRCRVPASMWPKLTHPSQDPEISSLFLLLAPPLLAMEERSPRSLGLKSRDALQPSDCHDPRLSPLFFFASVLGVSLPQLFVQPKSSFRLRSDVMVSKGVPAPALIVGADFLAMEASADRAFLAGQALCRLRLEHWLSHPFPTVESLQSIIDWATGRASDTRPSLLPLLDQLKLDNPIVIDQLRAIVRRMQEGHSTLDAKQWMAGQQTTCDRAGLLMCGDLGAAARSIASEGDRDTVPRMSELFRFSTSEAYFALRQKVLSS